MVETVRLHSATGSTGSRTQKTCQDLPGRGQWNRTGTCVENMENLAEPNQTLKPSLSSTSQLRPQIWNEMKSVRPPVGVYPGLNHLREVTLEGIFSLPETLWGSCRVRWSSFQNDHLTASLQFIASITCRDIVELFC